MRSGKGPKGRRIGQSYERDPRYGPPRAPGPPEKVGQGRQGWVPGGSNHLKIWARSPRVKGRYNYQDPQDFGVVDMDTPNHSTTGASWYIDCVFKGSYIRCVFYCSVKEELHCFDEFPISIRIWV